MINAARDANLITDFFPTRGAPVITHLQYANNTLLFRAAKESEGRNIIAVSRCYEAISGLKANVFKSLFIGISVEP